MNCFGESACLRPAGDRQGGGAHASHVVVPQEQLIVAPPDVEPQALAVLPYSFTTMWLAVRSSGTRTRRHGCSRSQRAY